MVGRFLEHSRVYRFLNGGDDEIYLSSADLMSGNLDRRLEIMFPIQDRTVKQRIIREAIELPLSDTVKLRWLEPDGSYVKARCGNREPADYQAILAR